MARKRKTTIAATQTAGAIFNTAWRADFSISAIAPNPAAKLDVADGTVDKSAPSGAGVNGSPNGKMQPGIDGAPPTPRFTMSAYNGGPMQLNGYKYPVIVDGAGVKAAAANLPIYVGHYSPDTTIAAQMEQLLGQTDEFSVDRVTGKVTASGVVTGDSALVRSAMANAKNGFKFQASINAQPSALEQVREGETANVNGQSVQGPLIIARAVTCDHIALVPLGADTSTSTSIAASAATKGNDMDFAKWLDEKFGLAETDLTPEQLAKFKSMFEAGQKPAEASAEAAADDEGKPGEKKDDAPVSAAYSGAGTAKVIAAQNAAISANMDRVAKVQEAAKEHPAIAAQAIKENWSVDKTELEVLRAMRKAAESAPNINASSATIPADGLKMRTIAASRGGRHTASAGRIGNDLAAVIETCGLISAGYSADKLSNDPAYGVRAVEVAEDVMQKFGRGLGPAGLFRLAAKYAGVSLPENNADSNFISTIAAEFSTLNLPVILSNLMNKFLLDGYMAVDPDFGAAPGTNAVAWQQFTKRGPVQDFKPHYRVRLTGDLEFQGLGPTGEIQHGNVGEQSYTLKATTRARMFGISREQIINDDLSAMSTTPTLFGRGAGIDVAKTIYSLLIAGLQSDMSTAFFTSSAVTTKGAKMQPNLLESSALSFATLEAAESAMNVQTDPYGQPFGGRAEVLLVPPGILNLARQLNQSTVLIPAVTTTATSAATMRGVPAQNTLAGKFRPVASTWLSSLTAAQVAASLAKMGVAYSGGAAGSATTWYLACGSQQPAYPIEAGFLNGQEMPIVERSEMEFDRLGIAFRGFLDFGASMSEQRSIVKCTA